MFARQNTGSILVVRMLPFKHDPLNMDDSVHVSCDCSIVSLKPFSFSVNHVILTEEKEPTVILIRLETPDKPPELQVSFHISIKGTSNSFPDYFLCFFIQQET